MKPGLMSRAGWGAMLVLGLACSDSPTDPRDPAPPLAPSPFLVSNPAESPAAGRGGQFTEAWVSLPPGALPEAQTVLVSNPRAASSVTAQVVNGGFDPVALAAAEGDTLDFLVQAAGGDLIGSYRKVVAKRSPPAVVRTSPPPNKRDVPLNTRIVVTFSEPMDGASLPGAVTLLVGNASVPGSVEADGEDGLRAAFTPAEPLAPLTSYRLRIGTGALDRDGDALVAAIESEFTTALAEADPPPPTGQIAFVMDGRIHLVNVDGTGLVALTGAGGPQADFPAWSPDGSRIAFASYEGQWNLFLMNADGSNPISIGPGSEPTWSPDGQKLAFNCEQGGLCIVTADPPHTPVQVSMPAGVFAAGAADWSPDGTRLALMATDDDMSGDFYWWDIWVVAPDGSGASALTSAAGVCPTTFGFESPAWSPDGLRIAFTRFWCSVAPPEQRYALSIMNADGSGRFDLAVSSAYRPQPSWSPDGRFLAFAPESGGIDWVSLDGTQHGTIVTTGHSPAWRP